jgi:hypothetical protein
LKTDGDEKLYGCLNSALKSRTTDTRTVLERVKRGPELHGLSLEKKELMLQNRLKI